MATYWDLYYLVLSDCLLYNVHVRSWKSPFLCAVKTAMTLLMIVCFARIGGERVLLLATTSWASITAVTPLLAQLGISSLTSMTVARFLMGLLQGERVETESLHPLSPLLEWFGNFDNSCFPSGVHYPSLASLCSQRVDEGERGFLMSTMGSGSYMG